ncbi:MAG: WD40 repeat domain-containing protein, partial [Pyrinomonadaceae bacterium]
EGSGFDDEDTGDVRTLALSSDGRYFATSDGLGDVLLWAVNKKQPLRKLDIGFSGDDATTFSPDGKTIAVGGINQNLFLFDVETGNKLWQLLPSYQPSESEVRLTKEQEQRQAALNDAKALRDKQAAVETEVFKKQVYITFDHFGDMTDPGEQRMVESDEPKKSRVRKDPGDANAVWLRLHNDSPLPIKIPTQSMYLPNPKCFYEFPSGEKILGLCDDREISVWIGLEDKDGKPIPYGFDFGSSAILLPGKSVLFAVPRGALKNGDAISFSFSFQKPDGGKKIERYGTDKILKFSESDLPKK